MTIEAVIFDMDGVLIDSEIYWKQSRIEFAQTLGKVWTDEDQRHAMGRNTVEWAQVMQERLALEMSKEDIIAEMKRRVIKHYEQHLPILPGALEAVQLAAQHYRVALASGSPTEIIQRVMQLTGLDKVFETMIYGDDMQNGKPAPDIYIETLRRLDINAENAVGIEDSANGVRALKAAEIFAIAVPSPGFTLPDDVLQMADYVLDSMEAFSLDVISHIDHEAN